MGPSSCTACLQLVLPDGVGDVVVCRREGAGAEMDQEDVGQMKVTGHLGT